MKVTTGNYFGIPLYVKRPTYQYLTFSGVLAPHGLTNRITYTVPANRRAMIELVRAQIYRATAAAPNALANAECYVRPLGVGFMDIASPILDTNTIHAQDRELFNCSILLTAGDVVNCDTNDASTGGTVGYDVTLVIVEFDP